MRKNFLALLIPAILLFTVPTLLLSSCEEEPDVEKEEGGDEDEEGGGGNGSTARLSSFRANVSLNPSLTKDIIFTVDESSRTARGIHPDWIEGNDELELIPVFTYRGKEIKVGTQSQLTGVSKHSFMEPVAYTIVDDEDREVTYQVSLFTPQFHSTIPVFRIEADTARIGDDYIKTKVEIIPNGWPGETWDYTKDEVEMRLRGNSTRHLPKRPYRLKFPSAISPLGLDHTNEKSWVLLANDCDKTLLRNAVAFEMSRTMHEISPAGWHDDGVIKFTPSSIHVDVFMDGNYRGVYQLSDQMQRKEGRIEVDRLRARDEGDPLALTGGYIIEIDIHAESEAPGWWFESKKAGRITIKYPDDDDYADEQLDYIKAHVAKAEDVLYSENFKDTWREYFDEATAADFLIVNEFSADPDAYTSIWLYKRRDRDLSIPNHKLYFGPVWDFDSAFDNDNRIQNAHRDLMIYRCFNHGHPWGQDHWIYRMWEDEGFRRTVKTRWNQVRAELLERSLARIDQDLDAMGLSVDVNFDRWNIRVQALDTAMPGPASYRAGVESLRTYIKQRYEYLDEVFNNI